MQNNQDIIQHLAAKLQGIQQEINKLTNECDQVEKTATASFRMMLRDAGIESQYDALISSAEVEIRQREAMIQQLAQESERIRSTLSTIETHFPGSLSIRSLP